MPEYPIAHLAEKFMSAFQGNPDMHGRTTLTGEYDDKGKAEAKHWVDHSPVTKKLWKTHLSGGESIGIVPATEAGVLHWAAFDVDIYLGQLDFPGILKKIKENDLPFIAVRSKSGGAHVYVFFTKPADGKKVIQKISEFTAFFGYGRCEIFPKQPKIAKTGNGAVRHGSWMSMPYNGEHSPRYAVKTSGKTDEAYTMSEFMDLVDDRRIEPDKFLALLPPEKVKDIHFPDGPPCLNQLWEKHSQEEGCRDTLMFNLGIYFKKKDEDTWAEELKTQNSKLGTPLEEKNIDSMIRSLDKDYQYQCLNCQIKRYCKGTICASRKYGIDGEGVGIDNQSLIQLRTDPSLWFFTEHEIQISLEGAALWDYEKVRIAFMEAGQILLPAMKRSDWHKHLKGYLTTVTVIDVPPEATAKGEFKELLEHWKKTAGEDKKYLNNNQPVIDTDGAMLFKTRDLKDMLRVAQFKALPQNKIMETLRNDLGGVQKELRIDGTHVRCWSIPANKLAAAPDIALGEIKEQDEPF